MTPQDVQDNQSEEYVPRPSTLIDDNINNVPPQDEVSDNMRTFARKLIKLKDLAPFVPPKVPQAKEEALKTQNSNFEDVE